MTDNTVSKTQESMLIDYKDSRPIYEQIVEEYKKLILTGALLPNEQMPSVRNLAMELSTNPNTVQKAYAELERQGFLYTVKGRGNFVCMDDSLKDGKRKEILDAITQLVREAEEIGIDRKEIKKEVDAKMQEMIGGEI